jgi:membrane-anchored protein YejM (alkaline phosphatase superfamily)
MTSQIVFVIAVILLVAPSVYNIWNLLKIRSEQKKSQQLQPLLGVVLPKDKKEK